MSSASPIKRWSYLAIGLVLYAVGIVFTINANQGLAPWDQLSKSPFTC